mmetsp:Transcript_428/g.391  ORF Transcript_428/g.391 Transcript_428/m.391 type:complete len:87 (+) Transcript_428:124-384(+)
MIDSNYKKPVNFRELFFKDIQIEDCLLGYYDKDCLYKIMKHLKRLRDRVANCQASKNKRSAKPTRLRVVIAEIKKNGMNYLFQPNP